MNKGHALGFCASGNRFQWAADTVLIKEGIKKQTFLEPLVPSCILLTDCKNVVGIEGKFVSSDYLNYPRWRD